MDFLAEEMKRIEAADEVMEQSLRAFASGNDTFLDYISRRAKEAKERIDARSESVTDSGSSGESSGNDTGAESSSGSGRTERSSEGTPRGGQSGERLASNGAEGTGL